MVKYLTYVSGSKTPKQAYIAVNKPMALWGLKYREELFKFKKARNEEDGYFISVMSQSYLDDADVETIKHEIIKSNRIAIMETTVEGDKLSYVIHWMGKNDTVVLCKSGEVEMDYFEAQAPGGVAGSIFKDFLSQYY